MDEETIHNFTRRALHELARGRPAQASFFLHESLRVLNARTDLSAKPTLLAQTYNYLGQAYLGQHRLEKAHTCLAKALFSEHLLVPDPELHASVHLNLATLFAELKDRSQALQHGVQALSLLREQFEATRSCVNLLIRAYQVVGGLYEQAGVRKKAQECYTLSAALAKEHLGPRHTVSKSLQTKLVTFGLTQKATSFHRTMHTPTTKSRFATTRFRCTRKTPRKLVRLTYRLPTSKRIQQASFHARRHAAACFIQAVWRGYCIRKRSMLLTHQIARTRASIETAQRRLLDLERRKRGSRYFQIRLYRFSKDVASLTQAAIKLQSFFRMVRERKKFLRQMN